jgi:N-glycosylase/DNA lyase
MKVATIPAPDFDLAKTLNSGQVFHWKRIKVASASSRCSGKHGQDAHATGFVGTIGDQPVWLEQRGNVLCAKVASAASRCSGKHGHDAHATVARYFALDHPLADICASFPRDPAMNAARDFCRGLRIIRQPKWECLAMFICSSMKQVAHIRQISKALRERFGSAREIFDHVVYTFPVAQKLAESSEKELRECALGYRAKNLLVTARLVANGDVDLKRMSALSDVDLRAALCQLPGVGAKVANCVMLFAYERLRAFPIDVWIERVLREKYFPRARKLNAARLRAFTEEYFGPHGGYAQQYLFHHARMVSRLAKPSQASALPPSARNDKGADVR